MLPRERAGGSSELAGRCESGEQLGNRHFPAWNGIAQIECVLAAVSPRFASAEIDRRGAPRRIEDEDRHAACPKPAERLFLNLAKAVVRRDHLNGEVGRLRPVFDGSSDRIGMFFGHECRVWRAHGVRIASQDKACLGAEGNAACGLPDVRAQKDAHCRSDATMLSSSWRHHSQLTPDELASEAVIRKPPQLLGGLGGGVDGHEMRLPRGEAKRDGHEEPSGRPGQRRRPPRRALTSGPSFPPPRLDGERGGYSLLMTFTRITVRADQMDGVPCIRGLRIPVATVVGMIAEGMTSDEVLDAYPDLELGDVQEALQYAAEAVRERELPLAG